MLRLLPILPLLCATNPLLADDLTSAEAELLPRIIDSLCIDLVPASNGCEQVFLVANPEATDTADLIILTDRRTTPGGQPLLVLRQAVFNGSFWGMSPWLEEAEDGQLNLQSEQIGIGRSPWTQTLTIDWIENDFILTAHHYSTYDRIQVAGFSCDVDYRAGSAEALIFGAEADPDETVQGTVATTPPVLRDLTAFGALPELCEATIQRYYETLE